MLMLPPTNCLICQVLVSHQYVSRLNTALNVECVMRNNCVCVNNNSYEMLVLKLEISLENLHRDSFLEISTVK